ncbi:probable xyloglucan endotransglucosylase/hydrolase protein 32 [Ananas comosus]|uniref:Xyloglucan endotransglucosylase/hydrolase n=2 Tax=Ananas comosus TaxID=4615 RepID=A0A6P5H2S0_ANACO|nr:probable xyloglucan endotransglucosylase/hydrolase protein 32 [Ananas comosus]CAD1830773.1 unnamed protein product [Ananas comosus var. bracteatus]
MALLLHFVFLCILHHTNAQPSPGYYPSYRFRSRGFYQVFNNLWGPQHQSVSRDQSSVTIWLDRNSGSGFKSNRPFRNGYFGASIKLQSGYTAGVITAFYLSNNQVHPGYHDEVDIEFLGTTPGRPYTLQTNVYVRGSGDGRIIGREMKFHLWFDPTAAFHNYAILWNQNEIIFFVDDIPIRRYPRKSVGTFPLRPMWLYASIWDASSWATDDGRSKADYRYQPFVAQFTRFAVRACSPSSPPRCHAPGAGGRGGLTGSQFAAMRWAQAHYMVYNYCRDPKRDHSLTPECF